MLFSKLHYQKVLNPKSFHIRSLRAITALRKKAAFFCGSFLRKGEVFACVGLNQHLTDLNARGACLRPDLIRTGFQVQLSGDEVYYINSLILLVKKMLCSKLHCQEVFNLKAFSCKIVLDTAFQQDETRLMMLPYGRQFRRAVGGYLQIR